MGNVVVLLLVSTLILYLACAAPAAAPAPSPTPTPTPAPTVRLTAKEAYDIALNHAAAKYGDVYLSSLSAGYATIYRGQPRYLAEGRSDEWRAVFTKYTGPQEYTMIFTTVENGEITWSSESDPSSLSYGTWEEHLPYNTIDVESWNIDSSEAVRIAEEAGGAEFTLLMLILSGTVENTRWRVIFGPSTMAKGEHPGLAVEINATSGEVIKTETKTFKIS